MKETSFKKGRTLKEVRLCLKKEADPQKAVVLQGFFKTKPGEYGSGDRFLGVVVPKIRRLSRSCLHLPLSSVRTLFKSTIHEERQLALFILVQQFQKGEEKERAEIFTFYVEHIEFVNNWDLVDSSAPYIMGLHLYDKRRTLLIKLAKSKHLWSRRVAILSTFYFIKQGQFDDTLAIAKLLLQDNEDLIHKAVGWMLREVGKRKLATEERFLKEHYKMMPRTMLRYAIERFPETKRKKYLNN